MNKNKKLLILVNDLSFFVSHRLSIAEAAISRGFEVIVGYGESGDIDVSYLVQKGLRVNFIPMDNAGTNIFNDFKTIFYIWKFFKKEKPDIVHLVTIKPYLYGGIISRITGVPALVSAVSGLGTLFINKNFKIRFLRLILYPFYKLTFNHKNQKVIIQNKDDLKVLLNWGVLKQSKTKLIKGSGVKLENFKNFDEPNGTPIVCYAARLLRIKGVYEYISAVRLLMKQKVDARFLLAGNIDNSKNRGLNYSDLNNLKKEGFEVLGYQNNIPELYSKSNVICLPSHREGFPKSLIEAAAASRAVVTTDVPGCRDAIIPNKTGLLVPPQNPQKLAEAIRWVIENPQKRIAMGKAARKFAEKEFPIEKIVQNHLDIYEELLSVNLR